MGVDAFFVLSGFLITSLLIGEWRQTLTIKLGAFWARRARRLLPALLMMLLFVAFFASVIVPKGTYGALRLDALSTLLYVSNWHFILINSNYFNENRATVVAPAAHLVAGGGGAVLPDLAVGGPGRPALHAQPQGPVRAVRRGGDRLRRLDGRRLRRRPEHEPGLSGHGHPVAVPVHRVRPGRRPGAGAQRSHEQGRLAKGELWRPANAVGLAACGALGIVGAIGGVSCSGCSRRRRRRSPIRAGSSSSASRSASSSSPLVAAPRQHRAALPGAGRRSATWAASPTASTSGTGRSSSGSTTSGRACSAGSSSRCGWR